MCREQKEQLQKLKEFKPDLSTQDSPRSQNTSTRPGAFQVKSSCVNNVLVAITINVYVRSVLRCDAQTSLWNASPAALTTSSIFCWGNATS